MPLNIEFRLFKLKVQIKDRNLIFLIVVAFAVFKLLFELNKFVIKL